LISYEFTNEELFSHNCTLFINNVIKFFGVKHFFFIIVILIIFFFIVDVVFSLVCVDALGTVLLPILLIIILAIELFEDVLNLPLELIVTLLHEVLKDLGHS